MRQATTAKVCLDLAKSGRFTVPVLSTAGFNRPLLALSTICCCPSRSKERSWPRNRGNLANVGLHSDASGGFWATAKQAGSDGGQMQRPGLKSNAERKARQNLRGSRQAHSAISMQRKSAVKNEKLYRERKLPQSHNNWSEGALAQYLRS
jgi:hypothetical protein